MSRTPLLRRLAISLTVLAAACGPSAFAAPQAAQPPPPADSPARPRIGLVLGGGSARGLAHIGVLEWLEEHRVPIDAVAGTSMGGLIGGAYSTGLPLREIRALTGEASWDALLSTEAPFEDKTFRRKQDRRAFPAGIEFGVRRGLWLPGGLNPGQRIALLIDRLTLPYSALPTFDDLPTPFRCVAFDINASESVALGSGILAEAMRATMAIPGIFPPVTIGGRLLVDGGFLDNVPVGAARQMHVDVVIAVDVTRDPASIPYVTALSMVSRAVDAVMVSGAKRNLALGGYRRRPRPGRLHLAGLGPGGRVAAERLPGRRGEGLGTARVRGGSAGIRRARSRAGGTPTDVADRPVRGHGDGRRPGPRGEDCAPDRGQGRTAARCRPAGAGPAAAERHRPLRVAHLQPGRGRRGRPPRDQGPPKTERAGVPVARRRAEQHRLGRLRADRRGSNDHLRCRGRGVGGEARLRRRDAPRRGRRAVPADRRALVLRRAACVRRPQPTESIRRRPVRREVPARTGRCRIRPRCELRQTGPTPRGCGRCPRGGDASRRRPVAARGDGHAAARVGPAGVRRPGQPGCPFARGLRRRERPPLLLGACRRRPAGGR